jgi:hypothetical protein
VLSQMRRRAGETIMIPKTFACLCMQSTCDSTR